jgi:hypothetical protein
MVVITEGAALPHMSAFIDMYLGCFMKTRRREKKRKDILYFRFVLEQGTQQR